MSKTYNLFSMEDAEDMWASISRYQLSLIQRGQKFEPMTVTCKRYRKPRSPKQLRTYWAAIGELQKLLTDQGYLFSKEELHAWVKLKSGFDKSVEMPDGSIQVVPKSISDSSDDATSKDCNFLIEFIQMFAAESIGQNIEIGEVK